VTRLVPLVKRRTRNPGTLAVARSAAMPRPYELEQAAGWLEDAKLFAAGWVAGLVVFGTFLA
jgi:hypothetical protein